MNKILLLEDDLSLVNGLTFAFHKQGFVLDVARTILEANTLWADGKYDLLVLDVSLPDGSGFEFCKRVRQISKVPIIFLTASDEEVNIVMGLDMGGDDYITKPFKLGVLMSRVNALLRRKLSAKRKCEADPADAPDADNDNKAADDTGCVWWLRSPGSEKNEAACVNGDGQISNFGLPANTPTIAVRPCIWVRDM